MQERHSLRGALFADRLRREAGAGRRRDVYGVDLLPDAGGRARKMQGGQAGAHAGGRMDPAGGSRGILRGQAARFDVRLHRRHPLLHLL